MHLPRPAVLLLVAVALLFGTTAATRGAATVSAPGSPFESLYQSSDTAGLAPETTSVNVGVRFTATTDGYVIGVEFLRGAGASRVSLYNPAGSRVRTSRALTGATGGWASGWFKPVRVRAGQQLTASVFVANGRYYVRKGGFARGRTVRHLTAPANAGVYDYGGSAVRPTSVFQGSEYLVSPVFVADAPGGATGPAPATSPAATPTSASSTPSSAAPPPASPAPSSRAPTTGPTTSAPASAPAGVTLTNVDGGAGYYGSFSHPLPSDPSFFPIGVWFEGVHTQSDVNLDKAAGLNTYVVLTGDSDLGLVAANGMNVVAQADTFNTAAGQNAAANKGWMLADEADMNPGPPAAYTELDKTRAALPADRRLRYANYAKGVLFWESNADAAQFVNRYQDIVSADLYWFSDTDACSAGQGGKLLGLGRDLTPAECHRAANYGRTVDRMRGLVSPAGREPVWAFVEVGHPFDNAMPSIAPAQVVAATWSSIIHGARGVIYFNHSFGGPHQSQHVLREPAYADVRAAVTSLDARIARLAPVLNAPTVGGLVTKTGSVDVMAKWYDGHYYLFAGSTSTGAATKATFTLAGVGGGTATVLDEGRSLPITNGAFSDDFADGNAVHVYRIG